MTVVIAHPSRQYSHQTALGVHAARLLGGYWTGIPCTPKHSRGAPEWIWRRAIRYEEIPLPDELVALNLVAPIVTKLAHALLGPRTARRLELASYSVFDRWAARKLAISPPKVFVGYESATLQSFRRAKDAGVLTVLDAASLHHATQDRLHGYSESPRTHADMVRHKDLEIALADVILTLSDVARDSYLSAGVPADKLRVIPLGADLDVFTSSACAADTARPFRFIFVGSQIMRKGVDLLLEAFRAVHAESPDVELVFVGGDGDASRLVQGALGAGVLSLGPMSHERLAAEYRRADCFVLPSRNDSFGMVVVEALASGVPVLVTDMVGAKTSVRQGSNGWVVPAGDGAALRERMSWCVHNRGAVRAMRQAARESAAGLTWPAYHQRIGTLFRELVAR